MKVFDLLNYFQGLACSSIEKYKYKFEFGYDSFETLFVRLEVQHYHEDGFVYSQTIFIDTYRSNGISDYFEKYFEILLEDLMSEWIAFDPENKFYWFNEGEWWQH